MVLAAAGCAGAPPGDGADEEPGARATRPPPVATPSQPPEPVAPRPIEPPAGEGESGDVPPALIAAMRAELAKRIGAEAAGAARLVSATAVVWPDGSLGCGEPGGIYTQALVQGYRVVFEAAGRQYAYHAGARGYFKFCEKSTGGGVS